MLLNQIQTVANIANGSRGHMRASFSRLFPLFRFSNPRPRVWSVDEVPVAFWAWRTQSPDELDVQAAVEKTQAQVLFLRAGQIDYQDGKLRRIRPLAGSFPKGIKLHLVYNTTRAVLEQLESIDPQHPGE